VLIQRRIGVRVRFEKSLEFARGEFGMQVRGHPEEGAVVQTVGSGEGDVVVGCEGGCV
jgi:hypothetical protein